MASVLDSVATLRSKRPRATQAERSAATRRRLMEAAIECLHQVGYSLTTVSLVADAAGVSRGALTHQFPSKVDLMLAVVRSVYESDAEEYKRLRADKSAKEAIISLPDAMWQVLSRPSAIAVIEIMLASRSDPNLTSQLRLMQATIDVEAGRAMMRLFKLAEIEDRPDGAAVHRLFVAAVRGLAIESVSMGPKADVKASIKVLTEVMLFIYPSLGLPG